MYRLRLVSESDKFKFIDVIGLPDDVCNLTVFIDVLKKIYLPTKDRELYWNIEGIYTIDGTEISKSLGVEIKKVIDES